MDIALYDLNDNEINISYSPVMEINGIKSLYVYFGRPNNKNYDTAVCEYPSLAWYNIHGFNTDDMELLKDFMDCHSKKIFSYINRGKEKSA